MRPTHTWYAKLHVDIASEIEYTTLAMTEPKVNLYVVALETRHKPRPTDLTEWKPNARQDPKYQSRGYRRN